MPDGVPRHDLLYEHAAEGIVQGTRRILTHELKGFDRYKPTVIFPLVGSGFLLACVLKVFDLNGYRGTSPLHRRSSPLAGRFFGTGIVLIALSSLKRKKGRTQRMSEPFMRVTGSSTPQAALSTNKSCPWSVNSRVGRRVNGHLLQRAGYFCPSRRSRVFVLLFAIALSKSGSEFLFQSRRAQVTQ